MVLRSNVVPLHDDTAATALKRPEDLRKVQNIEREIILLTGPYQMSLQLLWFVFLHSNLARKHCPGLSEELL